MRTNYFVFQLLTQEYSETVNQNSQILAFVHNLELLGILLLLLVILSCCVSRCTSWSRISPRLVRCVCVWVWHVCDVFLSERKLQLQIYNNHITGQCHALFLLTCEGYSVLYSPFPHLLTSLSEGASKVMVLEGCCITIF